MQNPCFPKSTQGRSGFIGHIAKTLQINMKGNCLTIEKLRGYMNSRFGDNIKNDAQTFIKEKNSRIRNLLVKEIVKSMKIDINNLIKEDVFTPPAK